MMPVPDQPERNQPSRQQSGNIKLTSPRLRVVFGQRDDPATWEAVEVQTTGTDMQAAEQIFARHKFGKIQARPIKFQGVLAWSALRATGGYTGNLGQFESEVIEVGDPNDTDDDGTDDLDGDATSYDGDGVDVVGVDPTRRGVGRG